MDIKLDLKIEGYRALKAIESSTERIARSLRAVDRGTRGINQQMSRFRQISNTAFGVVSGYAFVRMLDAVGDAVRTTIYGFQNLRNQLRAVGVGVSELTSTFETLHDVANETFAPIDATSELFTRLTRSTRQLGLEQSQVIQITRTIQQAIALSGASSIEASAAVRQLGQAFASGRLQGDEFRSISENASVVLDVLAKQLGVTRGELRKMSSEGKLVSELLAHGFIDAADAVDEQFQRMEASVGRRIQVLRNNLAVLFDELGTRTGVRSGVSSFIGGLGSGVESLRKNLDKVVDAVKALTVALLASGGIAGSIVILKDINKEISRLNRISRRNEFANWLQAIMSSLPGARIASEKFNKAIFKMAQMGTKFKLNPAYFKQMGVLAKTLRGLKGLLNAIPTPLKVVIGLAAALGAIFVRINKHGGDVVLMLKALWNNLKQLVSFTVELPVISDIFWGIGEAVKLVIKIVDTFIDSFAKLIQWIALFSEEYRNLLREQSLSGISAGQRSAFADSNKTLTKATETLKVTEEQNKEYEKTFEHLEKIQRRLQTIGSTRMLEQGSPGSLVEVSNAERMLNPEGRRRVLEFVGAKISRDLEKQRLQGVRQEANQEITRLRNQLAVSRQLLVLGGEGVEQKRFELELEQRLNQLKNDGATDKQIQQIRDATNENRRLNSELEKQAEAAQQWKNVWDNAIDGFTDKLLEGKASFKDFANSIITELGRIIIKQQIAGLANTALGFFGLPGFNTGGYVSGPSGVDNVNARLTAGEFVVNKSATSRNRSTLEAINSGGSASTNLNVVVNNYSGDDGIRIETYQTDQTTLQVDVQRDDIAGGASGRQLQGQYGLREAPL